ncbi:MAG: site-specific integrase, partial [Candidatus Methanomethylophilaceae archaeon]|nr:site-specific integrase [Candidatus Methanomethylophilaceae archaeon]
DYLLAREFWLLKNKTCSDALFFAFKDGHGFMSGNSVRKAKKLLEQDLGIKFDIRDCRRAFGQHYLDNDAELEDVSKLMGHKTTQTTETYYCGRRISKAIANVEGKW